MKSLVFAANWKMNLLLEEVYAFCEQVGEDFKLNPHFRADFLRQGHQFLIFAPAPYLFPLQSKIRELDLPIKVGAQKISPSASGAFTGEVSASMVKSLGLDWVLVGHSERRTLFAENLDTVAQQVLRAFEQNLNVMFCIGETLQERQSDQTEQVLTQQLHSLIPFLNKMDETSLANRQIFWAYEPVWAIGTGVAAAPETIAQTHEIIKKIIKNSLLPLGKNSPLLYGGSVNAQNSASIFALPYVEGGLVGGVSLKWSSFSQVIKAGLK